MFIAMINQATVIAYVGPGAGLSMLGTLAAVVAVLLFAMLAPGIYAAQFVWGLLRRK